MSPGTKSCHQRPPLNKCRLWRLHSIITVWRERGCNLKFKKATAAWYCGCGWTDALELPWMAPSVLWTGHLVCCQIISPLLTSNFLDEETVDTLRRQYRQLQATFQGKVCFCVATAKACPRPTPSTHDLCHSSACASPTRERCWAETGADLHDRQTDCAEFVWPRVGCVRCLQPTKNQLHSNHVKPRQATNSCGNPWNILMDAQKH